MGVVSLQRALWVFGGVQDCGWLLGLGVSWALWMVAVVVGLLLGVGCEFVLWVSVVGVVCWCGLVWFQVGFGVWGGQGSARAKLFLINKFWYPPPSLRILEDPHPHLPPQ